MFTCILGRSRGLARVLATLVLAAGGCGIAGTGAVTDDPAGQTLTDHAGSGAARISGVVRSAHGATNASGEEAEPLPVGGVLLTMGDAVTHSNLDGSFALLGVPAGKQRLTVDGNPAAAGDGYFGQFVVDLLITEGEDRVLDRPIYVPFVANAVVTTAQLDATTTVRGLVGDQADSSAPVAVLEIPPGGARLNGGEYGGRSPVHVLAPERSSWPLPERFLERPQPGTWAGSMRAGYLVSIQPVGLEFPVPVRLSIPLPAAAGSTSSPDEVSGTTAGAGTLWSLWSFEPASGDYANTGIGITLGSGITTRAGGVRTGGTHFFSALAAQLREPLDRPDDEQSRQCLEAWLEVWRQAHVLAALEVPGARTLIGRLDAAVVRAAGSRKEAPSILTVTAPLYAAAQEVLAAYEAVYAEHLSPAVLDDLAQRVTRAQGLGEELEGPLAEQDEATRRAAELAVIRSLTRVGSNVQEHAARFARLRTAAEGLASYYAALDPLVSGSLRPFSQAVSEFDLAYRDFAPLVSPIDAYDELVAALTELELQSRALVFVLSIPGSGDGEQGARVTCVCQDLGTTFVSFGDAEGQVGLPVQKATATRENDRSCFVVALDPERGLCSAPIRQTELAGSSPSWAVPVVLGVTQVVTVGGLRLGQPVAGTLTAESPVHIWRFDGLARQGLHAEFAAGGAALAGLAADADLPLLAARSAFDTANLADGGARSVHVYATDVSAATEVSYQLAVTAAAGRSDFETPITGTFDVTTRAAAVLFEAAALDRVLVEKPLDGQARDLFSYVVLGPEGTALVRNEYDDFVVGQGSEVYSIVRGGMHRVVATPGAGQFGTFELRLHRLPAIVPLSYALGTTTTGAIERTGQVIAYTVEVPSSAGGVIVVRGLTTEGPDPVLFSVAAADGAAVATDVALYFDGSSFARREVELPGPGMYTLTWRVPLNSAPLTGRFTFVVDAGAATDVSPVPEEVPDSPVADDSTKPDDSTTSDDTAAPAN